MKRSKMRRMYALSVLTYYRVEWTDISDEDSEYKLFVTKDLQRLIDGCMRRKANVPNAAKEVQIFLEMEGTKATEGGESDANS